MCEIRSALWDHFTRFMIGSLHVVVSPINTPFRDSESDNGLVFDKDNVMTYEGVVYTSCSAIGINPVHFDPDRVNAVRGKLIGRGGTNLEKIVENAGVDLGGMRLWTNPAANRPEGHLYLVFKSDGGRRVLQENMRKVCQALEDELARLLGYDSGDASPQGPMTPPQEPEPVTPAMKATIVASLEKVSKPQDKRVAAINEVLLKHRGSNTLTVYVALKPISPIEKDLVAAMLEQLEDEENELM
jgi:hypothetical protein